jgi:hypothetical protein
MSNILISADPSFTRTGLCIINLEKKEIYFETASCKIGEKQFVNVVHAAQNIIKQLHTIFDKYAPDGDYDFIHESPLPCSSMSAALYSLDSLLFNEFESHIIATYNPATLRSRIHQHKYDKNDSVELATKYLKKLTDSGYIILSTLGTKKKIPHDCCEAFLYAHLFLKDNGHSDFQFDNADEVTAFKLRQKELKRREKLLISGKEP